MEFDGHLAGRERASRAAQALSRVAKAGAEVYDRKRHLPRVLPVGPEDVADESLSGRRQIVMHLARALRAERTRGRAGHWTYDLNRHIALTQAYTAERRLLAEHKNKTAGRKPPGG